MSLHEPCGAIIQRRGMSVGAIKFFSWKATLIVWCVSAALSFVILHSVHTGPFLIYTLWAVGWPFFYFETDSTAAIAAASVVQFLYAIPLQYLLRLAAALVMRRR